MSERSTPPDDVIPQLGLRPAEAARAPGIGERLLWSKTNSGEDRKSVV